MKNNFLRTLGYTCGFFLLATCCEKLSARDSESDQHELQSGSVPHATPQPEEGAPDLDALTAVFQQKLREAKEREGFWDNLEDAIKLARIQWAIENLRKTASEESPTRLDDEPANPGQTLVLRLKSGSHLPNSQLGAGTTKE